MEHTGKRALVLAGGGAKGSYQIGVWRALQEPVSYTHLTLPTN